jgi:hypothetical protein
LITLNHSVTPCIINLSRLLQFFDIAQKMLLQFFLKLLLRIDLRTRYTLLMRWVWDRIYTQHMFEGMMIWTHSQYVIHKYVMGWSVLYIDEEINCVGTWETSNDDVLFTFSDLNNLCRNMRNFSRSKNSFDWFLFSENITWIVIEDSLTIQSLLW